MAITSPSFVIFCVAVVLIYYLIPKKIQWLALLAANTLFYFWMSTSVGAYILVTAVTVWASALWMKRIDDAREEEIAARELSKEEKKAFKSKVKKKKRRIVTTVILVNLGILAYMKYYNFFAGTINRLADGKVIALKELLVPLGISYYTFISISYLVDVYHEKYAPQKNPLKFLTFLSYFPQMVQGPIGRYPELSKQMFAPHKFDYERYKAGIFRFLWGLFKKLVIADRIAAMVTLVFGNYQEYHALTVFLGALAYGIQVYADFSGYMDIMAGISGILGIDLAENFRQPFFSRSVEEYWRRWHITLGAWFRDYLFYPISVSGPAVNLAKACRKRGWLKLGKLLPSYLSLLFVWATTGLWHGANWRFVIWGMGNCLFIMMSMQLADTYKKLRTKLHIESDAKWFSIFQIFRTFLLMGMLRLLSRANSFRDALRMYRTILTGWGRELTDFHQLFPGLTGRDLFILTAALLLFFVVSLWQQKEKVSVAMTKKPLLLQWTVILALIYVTLIFGVFSNDLIGGFIYGQF